MAQQPNLAPGPTLDLDNYVPGLITWLANKLSAGASQLYRARFGLGVIDWRVLSTVAVEDCCTAARICQLVGLDKAAVSRSIAMLHGRGLLELADNGGRPRPARLTATGRAMHDSLLHLALEREARLLAGLSDAEIAELIRLLHILLGKLPELNANVDIST